jgi:iron(III) transport system ATP-binding protein
VRYDRDAIRRMVDQALSTVSLAGFGDRSATRLSGGQQQRVALARAIVRQPRLLLLDEPLSNLDAALREEMRTELKRLQREIGVTTIYVTHDQAEALDMSDRIAVLNEGRIVQMGAPRDIYFRPANAFVAGFVGATNLVHGTLAAPARDTVAPVTLEGGQVLHCLVPHAAAGRIAVSIRPECIAVGPAGAPAAPGVNALEGRVRTVGFLGNMNRYAIEAAGTVLHASTAPDLLFPEGSAVTLSVAETNAVAVPQE